MCFYKTVHNVPLDCGYRGETQGLGSDAEFFTHCFHLSEMMGAGAGHRVLAVRVLGLDSTRDQARS